MRVRAEPLGVQRLRLGLPALPIALDDGGELFAMALALLGEPAADVEDVGFLGVAPGHLAERLRQGLLPLVDQPDVGREVHRGQPSLLAGADAVLSGAGDAPFPRETRVTLTAPPLKAGCFDTGSQAVMVSSFAALDGPPSRSASP